MTISNDIEAQLRQAIIDSDMTRYRIAQLAGVTQAQLSRFVLDRDDPRYRTLTLKSAAKVAAVLGLELRETKKRST